MFYDINLEVDSILPHAKGASEINESTSNYTKTPQKDLDVNNNSMQSAKKNTNDERLSIDIDDIIDDPEQIKEVRLRGRLLKEQLEITDGTRRSVPKTRARQSSLQNGQSIDIGGGRESVRNSLPFFSLKTNDVNRIGWAEELFSNEDKMLLNDRFVDIMIHKNLGDSICLKGGSYLLDVNNKIVIIGGSFKNPVIHFVMAINAENATYAQEIKEVIFTHEKLGNSDRRETSRRLGIYETYLRQGVVRGYDREDFGYSSQSAELYARLPEGFHSYGYTGEQQNGRGVSAEDGSNGEIRFSKKTAAEE